MKRNILIAAVILGLAMTSFKLADTNGNLTVNVKDSKLKWTGYHLAKSYEHYGYVDLKSGSVNVSGDKISSGEFVIDMNSISNEDLTDSGKNAKLVGHLKSDDFFAVEKYPEAKLVIKSSKKKEDNTFHTVGDLTIRGITKEVEFLTTIDEISDSKLVATADLNIKRTDFKVMYGWSIENAMLSGEFNMKVSIVAAK